MGNWRTVNIEGRMSPAEAQEAIRLLRFNSSVDSDLKKWEEPYACLLMHKSVYGLNQWIGDDGVISASGNLAERDFDNDDIEAALQYLAERFQSMTLTLHSGSNWEDLTCSATFKVQNGMVQKLHPEIEHIKEPLRHWDICFK